MKWKYPKKDIYLQKKENKLLMNQGWCNIVMEHQKILNLLDDTLNLPSKFRTKIELK